MSIVRKVPFARAEWIDEEGVGWIAEARSGTGVWVIRENGDRDADTGIETLRGLMTEFPEQEGSLMLVLTQEQRIILGMDDRTYHELNVQLVRDHEDLRKRKRRFE